MSLLPSSYITFVTDQPRDCAQYWSDQCLSVMRLGSGRVVTVTHEGNDLLKFESPDREETYLTLFATAIAWTLLLPITLIGVVLSMLSSTQSTLYGAYQRSLCPDSDTDSSINSDWESKNLKPNGAFTSPRLSARPSRANSDAGELFNEENIPEILETKEEEAIFNHFQTAIRRRSLFAALLHRCVIYALRNEFGKQEIFIGVLDRVANELRGFGWLWGAKQLPNTPLSMLCARYYLAGFYRGTFAQDGQRQVRQKLMMQHVNLKYNANEAQNISAEDLPLLLYTLWDSRSIDWTEKTQLTASDLAPFIQKTGLDTDDTEKWLVFFQAICLIGPALIAKQALQAAAEYFQSLERNPSERLQFSDAQKTTLVGMLFPIGNEKKELRETITQVATTLQLELQPFKD